MFGPSEGSMNEWVDDDPHPRCPICASIITTPTAGVLTRCGRQVYLLTDFKYQTYFICEQGHMVIPPGHITITTT
jgi:hypothetical protein